MDTHVHRHTFWLNSCGHLEYSHGLHGYQSPPQPFTSCSRPPLSCPAAQTHPLKLRRTGIGSGCDMVALSAQEGRADARTSGEQAHATSNLAWEIVFSNLPKLKSNNHPRLPLADNRSVFVRAKSNQDHQHTTINWDYRRSVRRHVI